MPIVSAAMARKKAKKNGGLEAPTSSCILLCDEVIVTHAQDKHVLQGIIGVIGVPSLPAVLGGYVAYIRLSNVYGSQKVTVQFEDAESGATLFAFDAEFPAQSDPLGVYTLIVRIRPFAVEKAGRYLFSVIYGGLPIASTPVMILQPPNQEKPQ
jgi:hypothetical protein